MKFNPKPMPPELSEKIVEDFRAKVEAHIDAVAESMRASNPGVPVGVLRNILVARAGGCACRGYLGLPEESK